MADTKWTPGPWRINKEDDWGGVEITSESRVGMIEIAMLAVTFRGNIGKEQRANARLIAAAPELYEALDAMLTRFGHHSNVDIKRAADALAKARGETG